DDDDDDNDDDVHHQPGHNPPHRGGHRPPHDSITSQHKQTHVWVDTPVRALNHQIQNHGRHSQSCPPTPLGSLLSSHSPQRSPLPPWSFRVAAELELRHARIETMLDPFACPPTPLISAMARVSSFAALPQPQFLHLVDLFKHACYLADHISDLALLVKIPVMARDTPPADPYMIQKAIHRTRQAFIKGLDPLELALLTHLAALGGMAYADEMGELLESDPEGLERVVAFKETVFREGSLALWGFLHAEGGGDGEKGVVGPPSLPERARGSGIGRYVAGRVEGVLRDLWAYEAGLKEADEEVDGGDGRGGGEEDDDEDGFVVLHGLHQTVMGAFPKPIEVPEESEGDVVVEDAGTEYDGDIQDQEGDLQDLQEGDGHIEEEVVIPSEPRELLILEAVRQGT
ncbi:hypothetical protein B0T21DRAFT_425120, partial [Apiosordaria backusii]